MAKFRKGDVVTIEGVVEYVSPNDGQLRVLVDHRDLYVDQDKVTMKRTLIEVGDTIKENLNLNSVYATVIAIHGEHLWVETLTFPKQMASWPISIVERVDLDETASEGTSADPVEPSSAPAGEA